MTKIFIYKEYDLIEELDKIIQTLYVADKSLNFEQAYYTIKEDILKIAKVLNKSTEVMIK